MGIIEHLKKLLSAKLEINIIYPAPKGVKTSTEPVVIREIVKAKRQSNYRFVEKKCDDGRIYYYTEEYNGSYWPTVSNTWFSDKEKALEAHLKVLKFGTAKEPDVDTILWEGLSLEETEIMVTLHG